MSILARGPCSWNYFQRCTLTTGTLCQTLAHMTMQSCSDVSDWLNLTIVFGSLCMWPAIIHFSMNAHLPLRADNWNADNWNFTQLSRSANDQQQYCEFSIGCHWYSNLMHEHNLLSTYAREGTYGSSLFLVSRTQFNSVGFQSGDSERSFRPVTLHSCLILISHLTQLAQSKRAHDPSWDYVMHQV